MKRCRKRLAQFLTVLFVFAFSSVFSQTQDSESASLPEQARPFHPNVKTILLLTSYPVSDAVTSIFFDSFRKGLREQNMPIDCHVVELNATQKVNEDRIDSTFERLEKSLNAGLYSAIVTLNHEAADVIMRNYDRFPRTLPVLFAGLGRMPTDLKEQYPNSTGVGIPDDIIGTVKLGLNLFPGVYDVALVADETTISERTRESILSNCRQQFPRLEFQWIHSFMSKEEIQDSLAALSDDSMVLFFPTHDYANTHDENMTAFMQVFEFERFPCLVMDDTLIGNGTVGGSVIETGQLGREAARMVAQIVSDGGAQDVAVKEIKPRRIVDYLQVRKYKGFSGRIPAGTKVVNKPDTFWTRHWRLLVNFAVVSLLVLVLLLFFLTWMRRRLRTRLSILYSLPGRVMVLNRSEAILFTSEFRTGSAQRKKAPKKLEQMSGIDYPKLSNAIHDVFQSGRQITIDYNYNDDHRAISFAPLAHDIFRQDAVICFSLDNTELQNARRHAEENADRFLLTLRSIGDGIITTDAQGFVTMLNPNAENLLGCKQSDVLGRPHTDFFRIVHEQTGKTVSSPLTEALRSGEVANGADMTDLVSASGQRYHIDSNAAPIHARSGEITGAILVFRDVTDERNKREELRQTMSDLEDASGMARLASFHYNFLTRIRTGSNLLCELWPVDENGRALLEEDFVYPEDLPIFKQNMTALFEKKSENVQFSFRVGSSLDDLRFYRMKLALDPRDPNAVNGIVQDVTELAMNMMQLKDTQALWDAAINAIPILFTVKDMDNGYRYLLCNKAFASVFNFSPDEIVGKTDHDLFHDETTLDIADQLNNPSTGTDGIMEIEGELPDGSGNLRYIKTHMRVFKDARGHRLLLAAGSDVTDMHRLFQNRGVINKLLEDIIGEDDFDLCIRRTLETVCKILGANRGYLLRHEEDGFKTQCVVEYVEPAHARESIRMLDRTLTRVRSILEDADDRRTFVCSDVGSMDWSIIPDDWRQEVLELGLRAIFLSNIICEGKVRGTIGFNFEGIDHTFTDNDVSLLNATAHMIEVVLARKHAQALIMDALERAQAADKAKSFFIASVSHEIRTPLNSVIGFAELLREGGVSKDQEKEYLDAISSSANALLMLINDVLDLSKLEANQMKIITAFTDFNALCREVMLIFTFRAKENDNQLISDVPEDLPELDVDNIRIRQIIINLLGNAVKFTKNGSITLRVSFTPDPDSADTGTLRCDVSDTGIGISEEDQKKLMEPFVQLSRMRSTNAVKNGTGLGLSISKRLATCMNGELTCASKEGEGSTFTLTLNVVRYRAKIAQAQDASKPAEEALSRDVKTIRILIVDDVPMNLRVAKALFNKIGFENVSTAGSGRAALEFLDKQPVDLILSDMWMPEMNGMQLSGEVKRNPKFAHIPIVAQTADVETSGNFDMSHFDAIILKPLTKEKLSNMVKRIIVDGDLRKGDNGAPVNLG